MVVFLLVAISVFFIGMMMSFGYTGTTALQAVKNTDPIWTAFEDMSKGIKGSPFSWNDDYPSVGDNGTVKLDKRMISLLTYLSKDKSTKCGTDTQHEFIGLSVDASEYSDLSVPEENMGSTSTLYRGVGARITTIDKIKCTQVCQNTPPVTFNNPGYEISMSFNEYVLPVDAVPSGCTVSCAVGYYPLNPIDASTEDKTPPTDVADVAKRNPGVFDYSAITANSQKASIYKAAQILYELLSVDVPGCDSNIGNIGSDRKIPTSLIVPQWIQKSLGDDWENVYMKMAKERFPMGFQEQSPLAGLSYDPYLNQFGIHINY